MEFLLFLLLILVAFVLIKLNTPGGGNDNFTLLTKYANMSNVTDVSVMTPGGLRSLLSGYNSLFPDTKVDSYINSSDINNTNERRYKIVLLIYSIYSCHKDILSRNSQLTKKNKFIRDVLIIYSILANKDIPGVQKFINDMREEQLNPGDDTIFDNDKKTMNLNLVEIHKKCDKMEEFIKNYNKPENKLCIII